MKRSTIGVVVAAVSALCAPAIAFGGALIAPMVAFAETTPETVASLTTAITGVVTNTVPDLGVYIAVGVVLVLAVSMARKFIRVGGR